MCTLYMYIHTYVYTCNMKKIYIYIYIYIYVNIYIYVYICIYIYRYIYLYMHKHICIYMDSVYTYILIYMTLTQEMTFWTPEFHTSNLQNPGQKLGFNSHAITLSLSHTNMEWNLGWQDFTKPILLTNSLFRGVRNSKRRTKHADGSNLPHVFFTFL